jgi:hypothetical protein
MIHKTGKHIWLLSHSGHNNENGRGIICLPEVRIRKYLPGQIGIQKPYD